MSARARQLGPAETIAAAVIARRFYVLGQSKSEIADELGISRFKVARIVDRARETGLVKVEFDLGMPVDIALSDEVRSGYGLNRVLVLERALSKGGRPSVRRHIGELAASVLAEMVTKDDVLGLAWSRSVNVMAEFITSLPRVPVVQLCGVRAGMDMRDRSVETVSHVAAIGGGDAYPIYGPLVLPDRRTTDILRRQPGIAETFSQFRNLTKAMVSIGAWAPGESTVYDSLAPVERDAIGRKGAVAEFAARLFDRDGNALPTGLAHHVLAVSTEELTAVPEVIALGYTAPKAEAIDAVLRSGMVTTLITDAAAAELVLDLAAKRG